MGISLETTQEKIGGDGIIVEIDESKIGKVKHNRGHKVEGARVVGGVEKKQPKDVYSLKLLRTEIKWHWLI